MNVKLKVLNAAIMAGFVGVAGTANAGGIKSILADPESLISATPAKLLTPERAAYAAYEAALQAVEAKIFATSCSNVKWDVLAYIRQDGTGYVQLSAAGLPALQMNVNPGGVSYLGTKFWVRSVPGANLGGVTLNGFTAVYDFDKTGGVMTASNYHTPFGVGSVNGGVDPIGVKVIKDFYAWAPSLMPEMVKKGKVVGINQDNQPSDWGNGNVIVDWGLQSLAKSGYTQTKYFQWSLSTRSDDAGETHMWKKRIYDAYQTTPCTIKIHTTGQNDGEGFFQTGTLKVRGEDQSWFRD